MLAHGTTLCLVAHRAGCPLCAAPCDILCALIYLRKRFPKRFHFVLQSALLCFTLCFALVAHGHKEANAAFVLPTAVHNPARNPLFPSGKENPFGHCGFIQAEQKSSTMGSVASCSGKEATFMTTSTHCPDPRVQNKRAQKAPPSSRIGGGKKQSPSTIFPKCFSHVYQITSFVFSGSDLSCLKSH